MSTLEKISGTIERFIFSNTENGYAVCVVVLPTTEQVTASGIFSHSVVGHDVELMGTWVVHQKFGRQFSVTHCIQKTPTTLSGLTKYLGSGLIKGIGPSYAEKLVAHFGDSILTVIEEHPKRLREVSGIGEKRAETISQSYKDQKEIAHIMIFLQEHDISPAYSARIYKQYRNRTIEILRENPYRLADEVWGIGFTLADKMAQKLGIAPDADIRIAAGIVYALQQHVQSGNLYLPYTDVLAKAAQLLGLAPEHNNIHTAYQSLNDKQKITEYTHEGIVYTALTQHYHAERSVAHKLQELLRYPSPVHFDTSAAYQQLHQPAPGSLLLHEDQQKGVLTALEHKVTIITGGPGTGKTTLLKTLLALLDSQAIVYKLAAPTGRAAKRMNEQTGRFATTLHRLLEIDPQTLSFVHNEHNALKLHMLIIDEASMIDIFLANALLKALPIGARLVLLGDIDQLPSVGPGNFLRDCLASGVIKHVRLTQIFRQAQNSLITVNAHRIIAGDVPLKYAPESRNDFMFIEENEPENLFGHIAQCYQTHFARHGIKAEQSVILTPMNRGVAGNFTINLQMQQFLNGAQTKTLASATTTFKQGDKVMQIRNNYEKLIFNGDCGIISSINSEDKSLEVAFGDKIIAYGTDELHELMLAYSMTIHKSQGSEYDAVIIPLFMQHYTLLARNLVYTALTRAKKLCIMIGQRKAVHIAIQNVQASKRTTFLSLFLQQKV